MQYIKGNLLDAKTQALVNTVNTVGVMGKGIALQFKEAFPNNYRAYIDVCKRGELTPGKLLVVKEPILEGVKIIVNFPTKTLWHLKSKYDYIEQGLQELVNVVRQENIKSIAIPPLGCGNGGLKWEKVRGLMEKYLGHLTDVDILIYEPNEAVKELIKQQDSKKEAKLTHARAMLLYMMFYYESFGEDTSLFVANKLAYFLRRLGEKSFSNLRFEASRYGPYTVQVEHMLHNINGKYLKGLEQMNAKAFEPLELQYDKLQEVSEYVKKELSEDQKNIIKNLTKIIDGFQSALSLEILATVDFVSKDKSLKNEDIIRTIHNWSDRKKKLFQDKYVDVAINHLRNYSNTMC
ncbi:phosphatase [Chryseotalea sanaruensis]|uniref:Phosphatase n=1 Tax=Chryseotalea sanaruensis TaxID=2482724 RepID=A0A401U8Q8_9BACT|nr:macro domain-containing protein [Chryseotalea sanaruensis]GCC51273.1 phosphatase [Chryseotalea sanaruensis]